MLPVVVPVDPQTTEPQEGDMGRGQARGDGLHLGFGLACPGLIGVWAGAPGRRTDSPDGHHRAGWGGAGEAAQSHTRGFPRLAQGHTHMTWTWPSLGTRNYLAHK